MKMVRSTEWWRLRDQIALNTHEKAKIDTKVIGEERIFFVPETEAEKKFLKMDEMMLVTKVPIGPVSLDVDGEWGWRCSKEVTEQNMKDFAKEIEHTYSEMQKYLEAFSKIGLNNKTNRQLLN